ncbi:Multidrug resistance protein MdtK [Candidatus Izimaplasma bacterium HR1]|jgi:putative MATE family efflux protein|uniref:MATE family efflux transporter n=1 Tax=Candidatus Izimoplasma sp. HR1 TaxID=1541959 RepID=UPI0004F721BA|nr:Multidrug resistance protein MdtK [Candidatus Izimaplasma bacterium HR1]
MDEIIKQETSNKYFYKKVIRLGLPITLSQLLTSLLAFIDTVMVSGLGDNAVAAVGIGANFFFLMIMINFGLVSGLAIFFAQFWGTKDITSIHKTFIISIIASTVVVFVFFIFAQFFSGTIMEIYLNSGEVADELIVKELGMRYLKIASFSYFFTAMSFVVNMLMRSVEKVIFPQIVSIIMVLINTFLNYALITGNFGFPRMEIRGAAIATVISSVVSLIIFVIYMATTKREVFRINFRIYKEITRGFVAKLLKKALPVALNETLWGLGMTMYLIAFGFISIDAIASYQITNQIMGMVWVVNAGVSSACAIMLGNKLGEGKIEVAKNWGKRFVRLTLIFGVLLGVILFFVSPYIPNLFGDISETTKSNIRLLLIVFSFYVPIKFTNAMHIIGTLRSGGDTVFAFIAEVVVLWGIGVPLAFILSIFTELDLYVIIAIVNVEEIIKFILVNMRFLTYKWAENLTH